MEQQTYTVEQVVRETIRILGGIMIPVSMVDTIGMPIKQAIHNLEACCEAWEKENENNQEGNAE